MADTVVTTQCSLDPFFLAKKSSGLFAATTHQAARGQFMTGLNQSWRSQDLCQRLAFSGSLKNGVRVGGENRTQPMGQMSSKENIAGCTQVRKSPFPSGILTCILCKGEDEMLYGVKPKNHAEDGTVERKGLSP